MPEQVKKTPCCTGLLAHVGASRREPHFFSFIPGPKTGDFSYPAAVKLFQGLKTPPYVVVSQKQKPQHMVVEIQDSALQPFSEPKTRQSSVERFLLATKAKQAFNNQTYQRTHS